MHTIRLAGIVFSVLLASGPALVVTGCHEGPGHEGPGERIGEKIDGNDDTLKDKLTPDKRGESAGKKLDKAVDDLTH